MSKESGRCRNLKDILTGRGKYAKKSDSHKPGSKKGLKIFLILVLVVLVGVGYFMFVGKTNCINFSCFQEKMSECDRASYVNENPEADWKYVVKGFSKGQCEVKVTLLSAKEGILEIDKAEGHSMTCFYEKGVGTYPEKDLGKCHGRLKEELQAIVIDKLHAYLVENLDGANAALSEVL